MNEKQLNAARDRSRYVAVAAPPGSGKSSTLIEAVHNEAQIFDNRKIALITFTNTAADVMTSRLKKEVGYVGTLHGYMLSLIRKGRPGVEVIDLPSADAILDSVAKDLRYKGSAAALIEARQNFWTKPPRLGSHSDAERIVLRYCSELIRMNKVEFDLILARGLRLLKQQPDISDISAFFIDEFQDSSGVDMAIYMTHRHDRVFVVGDPSQSIFQFRGANPKIFEDFFNSKTTSRHTLETNYRSTQQICDSANMLASHSQTSIKIEMKSDGKSGPKPGAFICKDVYAHDMMVEEIVRGSELSSSNDMAILCRTNEQVQLMQSFLSNRGLNSPHLHIGTMHWSKGQEFSDVVIAHCDCDQNKQEDDEDRCLFYVAMTRAKSRILAVTSQSRHVEWKGMTKREVSKFLIEAGFSFSYPQNR